MLLIESKEIAQPSTIVELVWHTHAEMYKIYRRFSTRFFGKIIFPEDFVVSHEAIKSQTIKYKSTLTDYKLLTGADPDIKIWDPPELRFEDRKSVLDKIFTKSTLIPPKICSDYVFINVYRLTLTMFLEARNSSFLSISENSLTRSQSGNKDNDIKRIIKQRAERDDFKKEEKMYLWRELYLHCSHIYFGSVFTNPDVETYIHYFYDNSDKQPQLFRCGNFFFIRNPFLEDILTTKDISTEMLKGFYRSTCVPKIAALSPDDVADESFSNVMYKYKRFIYEIIDNKKSRKLLKESSVFEVSDNSNQVKLRSNRLSIGDSPK